MPDKIPLTPEAIRPIAAQCLGESKGMNSRQLRRWKKQKYNVVMASPDVPEARKEIYTRQMLSDWRNFPVITAIGCCIVFAAAFFIAQLVMRQIM